MGDKTRVVVIDDQVSYADALELAMSMTEDFEMVGRGSDSETGFSACLEARPELVVCDYRLPDGETGTSVAKRLREAGFKHPILILTSFLAPQVRREVTELVRVSALSKDTPIAGIVNAMREMRSNGEIDNAEFASVAPNSLLSAGEIEVLEHLAGGSTPAEIAEALFLSLHSVRARIKSMHKKLEVGSQGEAIAKAIRIGLVVPPS